MAAKGKKSALVDCRDDAHTHETEECKPRRSKAESRKRARRSLRTLPESGTLQHAAEADTPQLTAETDARQTTANCDASQPTAASVAPQPTAESDEHLATAESDAALLAAEAAEAAEAAAAQLSAAQLSAAQRARIERNRLRARALQDARLVRRPPKAEVEAEGVAKTLTVGGARVVDSGGGFLLEEEAPPPPPKVARDAPVVDPAERPTCMECEKTFPQSYLFDTFGHSVCDGCRDEEGPHSLLTRTEAKSEFLLKDCDLDARPPSLRCVRRRNPHRGARADMRLYLRAQVEQRAREVWGSEEVVEEERLRRTAARAQTRSKQTARRLRALRMDVRSSLFDRTHAAHEHRFGPERHDAAADVYERACLDCGHTESYEKM